jgi:hypothetical protein
MTVRKHDYLTLEREYIGSDISIRGLCKQHGIKGYSSVAQYAREHGWDEKREKIRGRADSKLVERVSDQMAEAEADLVTTVRGEWLTVIRAATYKFAEDLKDPGYKIRVDDLIKLIEKGLVLLGEPSDRTEERHLELTGSLDALGPEFFRRLAERTRPLKHVGGGENLPSRLGAEDSRQN